MSLLLHNRASTMRMSSPTPDHRSIASEWQTTSLVVPKDSLDCDVRSKRANREARPAVCARHGLDRADRIGGAEVQVHDHHLCRARRFDVCLYGGTLRQHLCRQSEMLEGGLNLR